MTHPENCPDTIDLIWHPPLTCVLAPGHDGQHESVSGATWGPMTLWQRLRRFLTGRAS